MKQVQKQIKFDRLLVLVCLLTPVLPIGLLTLIARFVPNFECLILFDMVAWMFLFLNPLVGLFTGIKGLLNEAKTRWGLWAMAGIFLNVVYIPLWMIIFTGLIHSRHC
jgi:hypothetical protein